MWKGENRGGEVGSIGRKHYIKFQRAREKNLDFILSKKDLHCRFYWRSWYAYIIFLKHHSCFCLVIRLRRTGILAGRLDRMLLQWPCGRCSWLGLKQWLRRWGRVDGFGIGSIIKSMRIVYGSDMVVRESKDLALVTGTNGAVHWDGERASWEDNQKDFLSLYSVWDVCGLLNMALGLIWMEDLDLGAIDTLVSKLWELEIVWGEGIDREVKGAQSRTLRY